jgi:nucleoside phosphorylase
VSTLSSTTSSILLQIAMRAEADPFRARLAGFSPWQPLSPPLPALFCSASLHSRPVHLVIPGSDQRFHVDSIGTQPAAVTAFAAISRFRPSLIINAGTAGGFSSAGAAIGDVYISDGPVAFHDRRVPLGAFEPAGIGSYPSLECRALAASLNLKLGRLTTGDSLDLCDADARQIAPTNSTLPPVKDMEAAAIAWVAGLFGIPFIGLKAITDLVDHEHPTAAQFERNLEMAVARLAETLERVVTSISIA